MLYGSVKHSKDKMIINRAKKIEKQLGRKIRDDDVLYDFNIEFKQQSDVIYESIIKGNAKERTGLETQKPLKLLERIIKASSNKGDRVFDPFCGCATTLVAAEMLGREWVGIDISELAQSKIKERMMKLAVDRGESELAIWKSIIPLDLKKKSLRGLHRTDLGKLPPYRTHKNWLYGKQEGKCAGCGELFEMRQFHIDHYVPKSKGGTDHRSNLQLLCGACNSMKGDRPQAYLEKQLKRLGIILD